MRQKTLKEKVQLTGIGVHSAKPCTMILHPAAAGTGIVFEVAPEATIHASLDNVISTTMCTTLGTAEHSLAQVEHTLAALWGVGLDNVHIVVDGPEIPVMDGSSGPLWQALIAAGCQEQERQARVMEITEPFEYRSESGSFLRIVPAEHSMYEIALDYAHPCFEGERARASYLDEGPEAFEEIAFARTFGFVAELESLRAQNLAQGASLDNTVALNENGLLDGCRLRYDNEMARHKLLDMIGDISLIGARLKGKITAFKPGHTANIAFAKALMQSSCWRWRLD